MSSTRVVASTAGGLAAYAGLEHAIGELQQGAEPIETLRFESWPDEPAFEMLAGEPAMSLLPTYQAAGVATVAASVALGVWAVGFVHRRHGGLVLIGLSVVLLLVGGGFGPPLLGVIAGLAGMRIGVVPQRPPGALLRGLAPAWGWLLGGAVAAFLALVPGIPLLSLAGVQSAALVTVIAPLSFVLLGAAALAARGHDRLAASPHPPRDHDGTAAHATTMRR